MYFSSGSSKRRLDYFLIYFQAYYWFKKSLWGEAFPPTIDHIFKETITSLRPKLKLCGNYEEALNEVNNIRTTLGIGMGLHYFLRKSTWLLFFRKTYRRFD